MVDQGLSSCSQRETPDLDNRKALVDFTFADFMEALARDPIVVAARLEEERDRANGFAGYEADV